MWLRSGSTNNNPGLIAQHYMQCISEFGQLPARLRTDCGNENGIMAAIHCALRSQHTDDFAGALSRMYGSSTVNQRIESWWSFFRKQRYRTFKVHSKNIQYMLLCSQSCVVFLCFHVSEVFSCVNHAYYKRVEALESETNILIKKQSHVYISDVSKKGKIGYILFFKSQNWIT